MGPEGKVWYQASGDRRLGTGMDTGPSRESDYKTYYEVTTYNQSTCSEIGEGFSEQRPPIGLRNPLAEAEK